MKLIFTVEVQMQKMVYRMRGLIVAHKVRTILARGIGSFALHTVNEQDVL